MKTSLIVLVQLFACMLPSATTAQNPTIGDITETISLGTDEVLQITTPEGGASVIHFTDIRPGEAKYRWRANSTTEPESAGDGLVIDSDRKIRIEGQEIELMRKMTVDTGVIQMECQQITKDKVVLRYDPARAKVKSGRADEFDDITLPDNQIAVTVRMQLDGKDRPLTPRDARQLARMLIAILKTSNFNSNSTESHKITDPKGASQELDKILSRDHLLVTLSTPGKIPTLGGMVPATKIVIGLDGPDRQYARDLVTVADGERPAVHGKYSGMQCVWLMDAIKKIASLPPRTFP